MVTVNDVSLQYGRRFLFNEVNIKFTRGNCYGVIGANGAGKSTFLKILSGEINPNRGSVSIEPGNRMAVLKQNHFEFEEYSVLDTVMMGHKEMYAIQVEKNNIYMDPDATEADGLRAADLENKYGEMGGWTAESDAATLLSNLGVKEDLHYRLVKNLSGPEKVKTLLAQSLFGNPDILLLDEPTNDLDAETITWLADFLADFKNTVIVVSHDRYFLDMVCTHIADIDFQKINIYTGNYTFWYESSQLMAQQIANKNKKIEQKRQDMLEFIQRFSANASKSKQATSRKKALEKLNLEEIKPSSRKYPFIHFQMEREPGDQLLAVKDLSAKDSEGNILFSNVSFTVNQGEKIAIISQNPIAVSSFFQIIAGKQAAEKGSFEFGQTITVGYLPNENQEYFSAENDIDLINWLRQFAQNKDEQFIRSFLGRMLFSGEEVQKKSSVLSGGEKVRCMLAKVMLGSPNFVLLDEPTNHLDLESITALNTAMQTFKGNLLFCSHDHALTASVANRIIELAPKGIIDSLMNYDDYLVSDKIKGDRQVLYKSK
ncbi:MAG: ATP-binding cassette domain-containing protein [Saprospiraceae bacterium]|jgi:ATPase subunit of ABC transporter with duplicated ATPase domains|nr:ATP-binding cassette domain-containing protein [Saprospiraceae bacterium]MDP4699909.1 ATP-binding cassette domain-containing protein [Saprospiraceae bacterium]MDP4810965.1 ATP-binding cassette domain-containing protein [Saprospiraceae bacterium]MDP4814093.1 ATP-binding cassette domain-containing protein [Saprospiraceae bacterium]MDP5049493.1 ATP-binding cassette domain-containing protein [Saprospiraceae bacterium]